MMKFLKYLYNRLFNSNKHFIVWTEKSEFSVYWRDVDRTDRGYFFYTIKYYPYKNNKYELNFSPKFIEHFPHKKVYGNEHHFYNVALNKLASFQREDLIDMITLPDLKGIKKN